MKATVAFGCLLFLASFGLVAEPDKPTARALIDRHAKENGPIWADGDKLTFFYRGEAEQVTLLFGGDTKQLERLPDSDVWTISFTKPDAERAVVTYAFLPGKKG